MRNRVIDPSAYGAQNAARIADALARPVDARLVDAPADTASTREEDTQRAIIAHFRGEPVDLLQASVRYHLTRCPECGHMFHDHRDTGQTAGVPDLLLHGSAWPLPLWLGCEVKGEKTRLSDAQKRLHAAGAIVVARSVAQAVAHYVAIDEALRRR